MYSLLKGGVALLLIQLSHLVVMIAEESRVEQALLFSVYRIVCRLKEKESNACFFAPAEELHAMEVDVR